MRLHLGEGVFVFILEKTMRTIYLFLISVFLVSCSAQMTTENSPGLDSLKIQRDTTIVNTDSISYEFLCKGNEPFWQIEISKTKKLIDLYEPLERKTTRFPYSDPVINGDLFIFNSNNEKDKLSITLKKETCSDGMSEIQYNYSVVATLGERTLTGCAQQQIVNNQ